MIKSIPIRRSFLSPVSTDPIQTSSNLQIALNNSTHLTILDPKLPTIHKSLINTLKANEPILDSQELFDINNTFHVEDLEKIGFGNHQNLVVETVDEPFHFSRIVEPLIVCHKWSFVDPNTKDCFLGVLINTSDLFIIKRDTIDQNNYKVIFKIFHNLLDQLYLPIENITEGGKIIVSNSQYLSLLIESFEFSQIIVENKVINLLCLAKGDGGISIHELTDELPKLALTKSVGKKYIKQIWSNWKLDSNNQFKSYITLITNFNEVESYHIYYNHETKQFSINDNKMILCKKSRFLINQITSIKNHEKDYIILLSSNKIKIFDLENNGLLIDERKLQFQAFISGIVTSKTKNDTLLIDVSLEDGKFENFEFDFQNSKLSKKETSKVLTSFINKIIYKHQLLNSSMTDKGPDANNGVLSTTVVNEPRFINLGMKLFPAGGMIIVINQILSKNTLSYIISSQMKYDINLIPMNDINPDYVGVIDKNCTSLSYINSLWLTNYKSIPLVPFSSNEKDKEVKQFLENFQKFKLRNLKTYNEIVNTFYNIKNNSEDFNQFILIKFINHEQILCLQRLFTFNLIYLKSIQLLYVKNTTFDFLLTAINEIQIEQGKIIDFLKNKLIEITLEYIKLNQSSIINEFDKFVILNFYLQLDKNSQTKFSSIIPESSELSFETKFFKESFRVTKNDEIENFEDFIKVITSMSSHTWSRCSITSLPLLELNNKVDELKKFNYIIPSDYQEKLNQDSIVLKLLQNLNYCIYTGNKTYNST